MGAASGNLETGAECHSPVDETHGALNKSPKSRVFNQKKQQRLTKRGRLTSHVYSTYQSSALFIKNNNKQTTNKQNPHQVDGSALTLECSANGLLIICFAFTKFT